MKKSIRTGVITLFLLSVGALTFSHAQTAGSSGYSIPTPRPINPAASTTNPSALATQGQTLTLEARRLGR